MGMKSAFHKLKEKYVRFVERQGFAVIVTICVGVITATAIWTSKSDNAYVSPTPPIMENISAAQLIQQSLHDAATVTPSPSEKPRQWTAPLKAITILRPFDGEKMTKSGVTGIWSIHNALDLQCTAGEKVFSISDGVVLSVGSDQLNGAWILIDHGDGIEASYGGLSMTGAYIAGDKVRSGATIGFAGEGPLEETDMPAHLHLRVTQNGKSIDPASLW